nr:hypothetical protein CFP56_03316 [Quercus suber]
MLCASRICITSTDRSRSLLWQKALDTLRPKDRNVIPSDSTSKPEELILVIETYSAQSKGKLIKLPNGESFFVRDALDKISRWVKKSIEVGDTAVQYDPGHAALPWALVRLILQVNSGRETPASATDSG